MLSEIEAGTIETVIVKDMSRLGRNYLQVGYYTEILFPQKNVRFIAINNSVDSEQPMGNDFAPFLNIMNEWYAKDTSNKIKSVFNSRMSEGLRCSGSIPYGYNRRPDDKQTLVVDPVASKVVKHIFELAAEGKGATAIARILTEEKVLIPSAYTQKYHPEQSNMKAKEGSCEWSNTTIGQILDRKEYLGHTVLKKSEKASFKTDRKRIDPDDWLVFENTHEPIIDQELWDQVQKFRNKDRTKRHKPKGYYTNAHRLCGFLFCPDCGRRMAINHHKNKTGSGHFSFRCGNFANKGRNCTAHYINANTLENLLLKAVQRVSRRVLQDEETFLKELKEDYKKHAVKKTDDVSAEKKVIEKRLNELDRMIKKLYEDYAKGMIPQKQYFSLMVEYSSEQDELVQKSKSLKEKNKNEKQPKFNGDKFIRLIKKYQNPTEITDEMLRELIDKILVHEKQLIDGKKTQQIEIIFNFVGSIDISPSQEELEEMERVKVAKEEAKKQRKRKKQRVLNSQ